MGTAARAPRWVTLETSDGRKLAGRKSFDWPVFAGPGGDLFDWVEQEDGRVALRSLATDGFVRVSAKGVIASPGELDDDALFRPIDSENGAVAFQLADGVRHLSAPPGDEARLAAEATSVGPAELFAASPFDLSRLPRGGGGCCGGWSLPEEGERPGTLWNDVSHQQILRSAVASLLRIEDEAVWRFKWFWNLPGFEKQTFQGLDDADYEEPWRGQMVWDTGNPRTSIYSWHDHFYNPTTGRNYMRGESHAVTEGRRWFNLSVHAAVRALKLGDPPPAAVVAKAAHCLGVALHFLTDLTQPMHAGNFTNFFGQDGFYPRQEFPNMTDARHSGYENYAEGLVKRGYFSDYVRRFPMTREDLESGASNAGEFLDRTAKSHYELFTRKGGVRDLAHDKGRNGTSTWGSEADASLGESLLKAPRVVARFLAFWSRCVNQSWDAFDQRAWYRLIEPTMNQWICLDWGTYKRAEIDDGRDLLFFLFNPDGTWSIGCRKYENNIWMGKNGDLDDHWIDENDRIRSEPAPTSRFRLVRDHASGRGDRVWIYETTRQEAVTVTRDEVFNGGRLCRWVPHLPERQIFTLQKMGSMSDNEVNQIRNHWPKFLTAERPWYGKD